MEPQLYFIRGLPGSGKTTLAKRLKEGGIIRDYFEADQYFYGEDGTYNFVFEYLSEAHKQCQENAEYMAKLRYSFAVSNTSVKQWECDPYINIAKTYGYQFIEIVLFNDYGTIHNVPTEIIEEMRNKWEPLVF